jgi:hypothetical protein
MKTPITALLLAACAGSVCAQPSVGISIGINQPGVYGRINIGDVPRPALVLPTPVIISPPRVVVERPPVYLYVPPSHQRNWRRHCAHYNACGEQVYFVQESWVRERYAQEHPGGRHGDRRDDRRDNRQDRRGERGDQEGRGPGQGR